MSSAHTLHFLALACGHQLSLRQKHTLTLSCLSRRRYNKISDNVLCGGAQNFSLSPATVVGWGSEMQNNTAVADCPTDWPPR